MAKGMVLIEVDRCKGCGICEDPCPVDILYMSTERFNAKGYRPIEVSDMSKCTGCGICAVVCPDVVFTVYRQSPKARRAAAGAA